MSDPKLKKELSGFVGFVMVVGTVIGSGIFFKPRVVFEATGTSGLGLLAWAIGGLLALAGGLTIVEIGTQIPETGGMVTYLEKIYSKRLGFLVAWAQSIAFYPAVMGGLASVASVQIIDLFGLNSHPQVGLYQTGLSVTILLLAYFINAMGNKKYDFIQNITFFLKLLPIIAIICFALTFFKEAIPVKLTPILSPEKSFFKAISFGVLGTLFAMDGWMNVTSIAGELKRPKKDLPRAIIGGITFVTLIYLMINYAYLHVMSPQELARTATPAADVARKLFGSYGGMIISLGIIISVFGGLLGYTRAAWRIPYALGQRGWLPKSKWFSQVDSTHNMPVNSGKAVLVISLLFCVTINDFDILTDISQFVIWIFYILSFCGIFILRKRNINKEIPFKTPGYPIVPIIGILGAIFIVVSTILFQLELALLSLLIIVVGLPVYQYSIKKNSSLK